MSLKAACTIRTPAFKKSQFNNKKRAALQALAQARPTSALPFATTAERTQ
jgi:hypothetical protein